MYEGCEDSTSSLALTLLTKSGLYLVKVQAKDIWDNKDKAKYENYCMYERNDDQKVARKARLAAEVILTELLNKKAMKIKFFIKFKCDSAMFHS